MEGEVGAALGGKALHLQLSPEHLWLWSGSGDEVLPSPRAAAGGTKGCARCSGRVDEELVAKVEEAGAQKPATKMRSTTALARAKAVVGLSEFLAGAFGAKRADEEKPAGASGVQLGPQH